MKKTCTFILSFLIIFTFTVSAVSAEETPAIYEYHNDRYDIFIEKKSLSNEQLDAIVLRLLYGEVSQESQPYGISCTLFGHDYTQTMADVIKHNVKNQAPRCVCYSYEINICSKCNNSFETLVEQTDIFCC